LILEINSPPVNNVEIDEATDFELDLIEEDMVVHENNLVKDACFQDNRVGLNSRKDSTK
jgi:hypothetical protein